MVIENAIITIDPENAEAFEGAVAKATPIFRAAPGCRGLALHRIVGDGSQYRLLVQWDTVEHHVPMFWESAGFAEWQTLTAHYFTATPLLEYNEPVETYF
ncbi:antibiotic biosynthesis monooxygenase [Sphingomonas sp. MG17]|uniref:Antibiotic biosynthesis monooxygenase n=1 Tax=Sphingomonas tagetis TaxID=2949092 RepID=A0A9X2KM73_9SPHN|nr:antibiotic biosynthesis monooxygenase family protein [Sphingomonas tagetis]MCP3731382.1 antibiotic biosynthesis monooxygenase [Sphingomonas tagetis]